MAYSVTGRGILIINLRRRCFGEFAMDDILRVSSDDILYRLQQEEQDRAEALRRWRSSAHAGSARDDDHVHTLVRDAAQEIVSLRLKLKEAGIEYPTPPVN